MKEEFDGRSRRLNFAWQIPVLALAVILAIAFSMRKNDDAFASSELNPIPFEQVNSNPNNRELMSSFLETFEGAHDTSDWYVSNFTVKDKFFRNSWSEDNVGFPEEGGYTLRLDRTRTGDMPFNGGELQRVGWAQFGRIEAIMSSAPGSGAATGLFTHTNDYFNDPHDEIDIEWIGNRPNMVQFNIYRDGVKQGPWKVTLPYDASTELHLYTFEWEPHEIRWFVDGEKMFSITSRDVDIPYTPQLIITHLWSGTAYQWHGQPTFPEGSTARVRCLSYQTLDDMTSTPRCAGEVNRIIHGLQPATLRGMAEVDGETDADAALDDSIGEKNTQSD